MILKEEKKIQREAIKFFRGEKINLIPLAYKEKKPLFSWKKYQTERLTEEEEDLFFNKGTHNVAVICGSISDNLFILDFDDEKTFEAYFPKKDGLVIVKTGRKNGGYHVYFRGDKSIKILKCFNDLGQEVLTLKGEASYCVGPGSVHPSGNLYKFIQKGKIPLLTGDVREDIKKRARSIGLNFGNAESEDIDIEAILKGVPEGARDTATTQLIHYLRRQGASYEEAFPIIQQWNRRNSPSVPENELYEKVNYHYSLPDAYKYFYKTNPDIYKIESDLELRKPVLNEVIIGDVLCTDEKGKEYIDNENLLLFIESYDTYKCTTDTQDLLHYVNGLYVDDEAYLDRFLQTHLSAKAPIKLKAEMRKQIRDRNPIERSEINSNKTFMPVQNGLLNLDTHELEAFTKEKVYTSGLKVRYDAGATAPEFLKFVSEILPPEELHVIQEMFGYTLFRGYPSAKSFWLIGEGGNGKTVLTSILSALLNGIDNVSHVALNEMDGQHRFAGYELYGKFANIVPEPTTTRALETPFLKAATGESAISVERKGVQRRVQFTNFAKVIIEANSVPRIADEKQALWDRIIAVEFPYVFRGRDNERHDITKELTTPDSLSGILNWSLDGLRRLRTNNWHFSSSIQQENIKISMEIRSNPIAAFKDNWLSFSRHDETPVHSIYDAYNLFAALNGTESLHNVAISKGLLTDKRITTHRVQHDGRRGFVFRGCSVSSKIVCAYGWYDGHPLRLGEFDELKDGEKVEVRTCSLGDYCLQYPEPSEEVQQVVGGKLVILNTPGLMPLYKMQAKEGTVKHMAPQEQEYRNTDTQKKEEAPLFVKAVSPIDQAICSRCGKYAFLGFKMVDEKTNRTLICSECAKELEALV